MFPLTTKVAITESTDLAVLFTVTPPPIQWVKTATTSAFVSALNNALLLIPVAKK